MFYREKWDEALNLFHFETIWTSCVKFIISFIKLIKLKSIVLETALGFSSSVYSHYNRYEEYIMKSRLWKMQEIWKVYYNKVIPGLGLWDQILALKLTV